jgi:predicted dehydrogenase
MSDSLRLVTIGAAGHMHLALGELDRHTDIHWVGYAPSYMGEDMGRLERDASTWSAAFHDDWRSMLDDVKPDIVVVGGRYDLNAPLAIEAARRGCHVLSEKPAAQTLEDLATLEQTVRQAGRVYMLMLPLRYEPAFYTAHQIVHDGMIGTPLLITGQKSYRWGTRPEWYGDRTLYGSTMTWVGIHAFDFAAWAAGVNYTQVWAQHANLAHPERPGCQDVAAVLARLDNGGSAVFTMDYLRPEASATHGDDRLRIAGSKGVVEVWDTGQHLRVITAEQDVAEWPLVSPGRTLFDDFIAAIEGTKVPLITAEECFAITRFAIRCAQAADYGGEAADYGGEAADYGGEAADYGRTLDLATSD